MKIKLKMIFLILILTKNLFGYSVCQTNFGRCEMPANLPYNSACYCGYDKGWIIFTEAARRQPLSNVCQTYSTFCYVNYAPIGTVCGCMTPYGGENGYIVTR